MHISRRAVAAAVIAAVTAARAGMIVLVPAGLLLACSTRQAQPVAIRPAVPVEAASAAPPTAAEVASAQMIWALRGGLNVAALLCPDRSITANYNQMLKTHRNLLNEAYAAEQARFRALHGAAGDERHGRAMTRLYNGFASVPDRQRFCTMAAGILAEVVSLPSDALAQRAQRALTTLEPGAVQIVNSAN